MLDHSGIIKNRKTKVCLTLLFVAALLYLVLLCAFLMTSSFGTLLYFMGSSPQTDPSAQTQNAFSVRLFPRRAVYEYLLCCRGGPHDQYAETGIVNRQNILTALINSDDISITEKRTLLKAFIDKGVDVNSLNWDVPGQGPGYTPLDAAIVSQSFSKEAPQIVEFLLAQGARLDVKSSDSVRSITPEERARFFVEKYHSQTAQDILDIIHSHQGE